MGFSSYGQGERSLHYALGSFHPTSQLFSIHRDTEQFLYQTVAGEGSIDGAKVDLCPYGWVSVAPFSFLMSTMSSLVFLMLSSRLLPAHHADRQSSSST